MIQGSSHPIGVVDEMGAHKGNADDGNPDGKRGCQWVMVTAMVTVLAQGLCRWAAAAIVIEEGDMNVRSLMLLADQSFPEPN